MNVTFILETQETLLKFEIFNTVNVLIMVFWVWLCFEATYYLHLQGETLVTACKITLSDNPECYNRN
jgi:hypothetical protein